MSRHGRGTGRDDVLDDDVLGDDVRDDDPTGDDAEPDDGAEAVEAAERPRRGGRPAKEGRLDFLYRGNGGIDVIGRSRTWYLASAAVLLVCIGVMVFRGFNFGIDFEGGSSISFPATGANGPISTTQAETAYSTTLNQSPSTVQVVGTGPTATVQIRSAQLDQGQIVALRETVVRDLAPLNSAGVPDPAVVTDSLVSASWGGEITRQAIIALLVFLVLVTVYLTFYFDFRMAVGALATLVFDLVVTAGVYSLVGFEVSPATVIGLLTVLGFSLYDTVIVFDKVRENTRGLQSLTRRTFAEAANLAVNQTLMRSFNTSLTSALPLVALLVVGVALLGVGVLGDLALVQLVGTVVGVASSVVVATPLVVTLAMRDPKWIDQARRVANRRAKDAARRSGAEPVAPGTATGASAATGPVTAGVGARRGETRGDGRGPAGRSAPATPRPGARPAGKANRPTGKRQR